MGRRDRGQWSVASTGSITEWCQSAPDKRSGWRSGVSPGDSGATPGVSWVSPGVTGASPGESRATPGVSRGSPGEPGATPGVSGVCGRGKPLPRSCGSVQVLPNFEAHLPDGHVRALLCELATADVACDHGCQYGGMVQVCACGRVDLKGLQGASVDIVIHGTRSKAVQHTPRVFQLILKAVLRSNESINNTT